MERRIKPETVIHCNKCQKNIKVPNYRIHMWFCAGTEDINPVLQNMFKSQLHMSKRIHELLGSQDLKPQETIQCIYCSFQMKLEDLDTHPAKCPFLPIECPSCHIQFPKDLMNQHDQVCESKNRKHNRNDKEINRAKPATTPDPPPIKKDEPCVDQHVEFLMRQLAQNFGIMKSKALTNKQMIQLKQSCFKMEAKSEGETCAICDIEFQVGQSLAKLPCGHRYHRRCICGWFSVANTCPMCRHEIKRNTK